MNEEETMDEREEETATAAPSPTEASTEESAVEESGTDTSEDPAPESEPAGDGESEGDESYRRQAEEDLAEIARLDPAAGEYTHLGEMPGALRFAELRGLGLSVREAYYAVRGASDEKPLAERGGRAHLHGSVPGRAAAVGIGMSAGEIEGARRLFPHLSDREITALYRRVREN